MEKRLYRNENDKMLAGVCSGLADYFEMDVTWMRIIFVFAAIFGFSGVLIYLILWIVVPPKPFRPNFSSYNTDYRVYEDRGFGSASGPAAGQSVPPPPYMTKESPRGNGNGRLIAGLILLALGGYFLLEEFDIVPEWFDLGRLWPIAIIALGVLLISKAGKKTYVPTEADAKPQNDPNVSDATSSDDHPLT
ncbi:MAG TPA: PspC domain-containing protein [Sphingobacteriaceae bacterium]